MVTKSCSGEIITEYVRLINVDTTRNLKSASSPSIKNTNDDDDDDDDDNNNNNNNNKR
jgi:hypothetical protein